MSEDGEFPQPRTDRRTCPLECDERRGTVSHQKFRVVVGPYRIARRYAAQQGWSEDEVMIVTRGHMLAQLDPALIASIITVKLHTMGARVITEIREQIEQIRALWPQVHTVAAAA